MSASHQVFNSIELLQIIVESFASHPSSLAVLSRVAQPISSLALDILWRSLPTTFYLLKLLPSFALIDGRYGLTREVLPEEWTTFDYYSTRVQEFKSLFSSRGVSGVDDIEFDIFVKLQMLRPGREPFPNLQLLRSPSGLNRRGRPPLMNLDGFLMPFASSHLLVVHLSLAKGPMHDLCSRLSTQAPKLQELRLVGSLLNNTLDLVLQFRRLRYLDINYRCTYRLISRSVYITFLNGLSSLGHLDSLLLFPPIGLQSDRLCTFGFQSLKRLAITGNIQSFTTICNMTSHIKHITLFAIHNEPLLDWLRFFDHLRRQCRNIRHLEIHVRIQSSVEPLRVIDFLEPLRSLGLTALYITSVLPLELRLSDRDMHILGTWWPELRYLDLFATGDYLPPDAPTFQSVVTLVKSCHDLKHLRINICNECVNMPSVSTSWPSEGMEYAPFGSFI